jgi:phosphopantothenate-cysteine ligase/phosphopantothenoylcysteine decarboxylase/phosphopantothenate--cysteine ligase
MKILITGGNTQIPIDKVRVISNIFKGKTAIDIAIAAQDRGHGVTLVGNPHMQSHHPENNESIDFISYNTYDDLYSILNAELSQKYDAIIHSAAVSDYYVEGVYSGAYYRPTEETPKGTVFELARLENDKKVGSNHSELFLKLKPTEKIVDKFREWGFKGKLVKFKLQVGISDKELVEIATKSRETSDADLIVANCLEWAKDKAYIIDRNDIVERVKRVNLASQLLDHLEGKI